MSFNNIWCVLRPEGKILQSILLNTATFSPHPSSPVLNVPLSPILTSPPLSPVIIHTHPSSTVLLTRYHLSSPVLTCHQTFSPVLTRPQMQGNQTHRRRQTWRSAAPGREFPAAAALGIESPALQRTDYLWASPSPLQEPCWHSQAGSLLWSPNIAIINQLGSLKSIRSETDQVVTIKQLSNLLVQDLRSVLDDALRYQGSTWPHHLDGNGAGGGGFSLQRVMVDHLHHNRLQVFVRTAGDRWERG